jgi:type VI secretion system (T6SS) baseplate-like injector VgrG
MSELLNKARKDGLEALGMYYGRYRGYVHNRKDPKKLGRLILSVPQIWAEPHEYWAEPAGMAVGSNAGIAYIPEQAGRVWVTFQNGDCRYPLWEHGDWLEGEEIAELYDDAGEPNNIVMKHSNNIFSVLSSYGISLVTKSGKKISLGSLGGSNEPAVLGNKNTDAFDAVKKCIQDLNQTLLQWMATDGTILTGLGLTGVATLGTGLGEVTADIVSLETKIPLTKSSKVTLD